MRAVGLMSGTSLDGIDAALVTIEPRVSGFAIELVRFATTPFAAGLRARLLAALPPNAPSPADVAALDRDLGDAFARAARSVADAAGGEAVDFVASHGLTLFHRGERNETVQVGDPYRIRDAMGASVVFDFRRADCAAGGQGAPLVPYADALLFAAPDAAVVALNVGGIANVTVLEPGAPPRAWDTGPGIMLLDAFVAARTDGAQRFDADGALAARGRVNAHALRELLAREAFYLAQPPPKSTGRERFGLQLLDAQRDLFAPLSLEAGCATLCAFTAASIAESLALYGPARARLVVSGGGSHNATLLRMLAERMPAYAIETSDACGIDADAKEAIAFVVLAYETLRGRPSNVPSATGARADAVLGAIAPHALGALLAKIEASATAKDTR